MKNPTMRGALILVLLFSLSNSYATSYTFKTIWNSTKNWHDPRSWSPTIPPAVATGTDYITINSECYILSNVSLSGYVSVVNSGPITVRNGATFTLNCGSFYNAFGIVTQRGSIFNFTGIFQNAYLLVNEGTSTLNGTVTPFGSYSGIRNSGTLNNYAAMSCTSGYPQTNEGTINNYGSISLADNFRLTNLGTILSSGSFTMGTGAVFCQNNTMTNTGNCSITGSMYNNGNTETNGTFNVQGNLYQNANFNNGNTNSTATCTINGTLPNYGTISNSGTLTTQGTFLHHGTFVNNNTVNNAAALTNNNVITNNGTFGNQGAFLNYGTLLNYNTLNNSGTLTNNGGIFSGGSSGGVFTNSGTFNNSAEKEITINTTLDNTGTINNSGRIAGAGTINWGTNFNNTTTAEFSPVASNTGVLTINGSSNWANAVYYANIGGTAANQTDKLNCSGAVNLNNMILSVIWNNGFTPSVGDVFTVMTFASRTGTIGQIYIPAIPDIELTVGYTATSVTLTAIISPTYTFLGAIDNDFTNAANWDIPPPTTPSNTALLRINANCTLSANRSYAGRLLVTNNATLTLAAGLTVQNELTIHAGSTLIQNGAAPLSIAGRLTNYGTLTNNQTLNCTGNLNNVGTITNGGTMTTMGATVTNNGTLTNNQTLNISNFTNNGTLTNTNIFSHATNGTFINSTNGIFTNSGNLTLGYYPWVNQGILLNTGVLDLYSGFSMSPSSQINNTGTLNLNTLSTIYGNLTTTNGVFTIGDIVHLAAGATLNCGSLGFTNGSNPGRLIVDAGATVNHAGTTNLNTPSLSVRGTFINTGTLNLTTSIDVNGTFNSQNGALSLGAYCTLSGDIVVNNVTITSATAGFAIYGGSFTLNGTMDLRNTNGIAYVNGATINCNGTLTLGSTPLVNYSNASFMSVNAGGNLILDYSNKFPEIITSINTGGTLSIPANCTLIFSNPSELKIQSGGVCDLNGTLTQNYAFINDGTIKGTGTVNGSVVLTNTGTVAPGNSPGCIAFGNGFTNVGTLQMDINGATACTGYDQINVTGTATQDGTLSLNFGTYVPTGGQTFQLINATTFSNDFTTVSILPSNIVGSYDAATGIFTVSTVLSAELLAFTGRNTEGGNLLTWTTANEINNKGFQIERATPQPPQGAFEKWDILGFVNNKAGRYDFLDTAPPSGAGVAYYRLRQIDNDGKETLSKVVSILNKANSKLKVYPNPVSNVLGVERNAVPLHTVERNAVPLHTVERNGVPFYILNLLGQQVLSGQATQRIDVSALPQGTYFLKVGAEQVKFVKQ